MVTPKSFLHWRNALVTEDRHISYFNFWDGQSAEEIWFTGFLKHHGLLSRYPHAHFSLFSTLGSINLLHVDKFIHPLNRNHKRIFFTGENVHNQVFANYNKNLLNCKSIHLSLGFDYLNNSKYLRFPIWILEMFPPQSNVEDIKKICNNLSYQTIDPQRNRFCALVSGTSTLLGTESIEMRTQMVQQLNTISHVDCAGKLLHNTDELKQQFNDNKAEFLKQYKFYICPENTSVDGYVTEKVFHAIGSGCIPIYWGACGNPEPDVLNHDAILFWDKEGDNKSLVERVRVLQENPEKYKDFFEQPRLQPDAWLVVAGYFERLEQKLNALFR